MPRRPRYIPEGGSLVEVTCRTVQGRYLFRPSPELNEIVHGLLGCAQGLHNVRICLVSVLSNHFHLPLDIDDAQQLSKFMHFFNSNLAKEVNRLTGGSGPVFERRYTAILVSDEEEAQVRRFRYGLANSTKEALVEKPQDWPGVHSIDCLLNNVPMTGYVFRRTEEYAARRRGETFERYIYATAVTVELSPLPCWRHLSPEQRRTRVAGLVRDIEAEAAAERKAIGREVLGAEAVTSMDPKHRPERLDRSPAPRFHAYTRSLVPALGGLLPVRGRFPLRRRQTQSRRPGRPLPKRQLPARTPVRDRLRFLRPHRNDLQEEVCLEPAKEPDTR